ncbi:serine O-acetyltransferase [Devosia sp. J2-20]|jgi:serine O-acetyltransferase|uniref:Serine acetyltransferase n=1 Tax=Devosia litorisediminis TaxID=2829817 RepID=A0A942E4D4_9HYPH|nr:MULTISPECIES: serine O-acetyltransferase [Devosia]MBS3847998.1 serine O-acetyltransferase [Devosia litorisediminis]MCZ4345977.1 serine O-acetyltransferase [Devosia neptuniae]WDQ98902.1 serine O-acetyltransferase [Devosia sp. J2-20]|tara:strand:- start:4974 stop:5813 length:840 start_codon:yes stop_codon:yes gene_type:complete
MTTSAKTAAKARAAIKSVDPVWEAVRAGARQIVEAEPSLASLAVSAVLNHETFEQALAHRLAARLDHEDVSSDLIRQAFAEILQDFPEIAANARADLAATLERDPACHRAIEPLLFFKGYQAIQTHRFAHAMYKAGRRDFALYLQSRSSQVFQVDINPAVVIGKGIMLDHGTGLVIGETAVVGDNVSILQGVTLGGTGKSDQDRHPKIGNGVLIGAGAKVLGNIKIGDCSRVGAGSVVLKEVPPRVTVAGVPAKVIGTAGCAQPALVMDQMVLVHDAGS